MRVTGLRIYPVKSLGGVEVESVVVEPSGFAGDRRWALVDDAGDQVTAREVHQLLRLTAEAVDDDTIRLTDRADDASILVDTPLGLGPVPVGVSRQPFLAPADEDVNIWISDRVGARVRLVWQEDPASRPISGAHGGRSGDVMTSRTPDPAPRQRDVDGPAQRVDPRGVRRSGYADIDAADISDAPPRLVSRWTSSGSAATSSSTATALRRGRLAGGPDR